MRIASIFATIERGPSARFPPRQWEQVLKVNPTAEIRERAAAQQSIPRGMVPTDLVGIMYFFSTAASAFITAQTIACDGGYTHSS